MKTYKQTFEIIDYARSFHRNMRDYYDPLNEKAEKQRVKMLLKYHSRHEKHREESLAKYEKEASGKVLNSWFIYIPENVPADCFKNTAIKLNKSVDDVVSIALHFNNCLVELYKGLIKEADTEEVRDVFACLLKQLEQEERNLVRDASRLNDV